MANISFYVLPSTKETARLGLTLKLAEKAFHAKEKTLLLFDESSFMAEVDTTLWGMGEEAFIPHEIITHPQLVDPLDTLYLSQEEWEIPNISLLINLSQTLPKHLTSYQRVFEIISQNPTSLEISRQRYQDYRTLGYRIETHKL